MYKSGSCVLEILKKQTVFIMSVYYCDVNIIAYLLEMLKYVRDRCLLNINHVYIRKWPLLVKSLSN